MLMPVTVCLQSMALWGKSNAFAPFADLNEAASTAQHGGRGRDHAGRGQRAEHHVHAIDLHWAMCRRPSGSAEVMTGLVLRGH